MLSSRKHKPFNKHGLKVSADDKFKMLGVSIGDINETLYNKDIQAFRDVIEGVSVSEAVNLWRLKIWAFAEDPATIHFEDARTQHRADIALSQEDRATIVKLCNAALGNRDVSFSDYENDV